jgi:hypothetical protein
MDHRIGRDHLAVQQRPPRQNPMKRPAMPVGPIHHGCNCEQNFPDYQNLDEARNHFLQ